MASQNPPEDSEISNPVKRIRWATHRVQGEQGNKKRESVLGRLHKRIGSGGNEKRDEAEGHPESKETPGAPSDENATVSDASDEGEGGRTVYFNIPLPAEARDEEGHPRVSYVRNKIRTAKYTPLSFVPKNLWLQFHNIANIYFAFIIILGVSIWINFWPPLRMLTQLTGLLYFRSLEPRPQCRSSDRHSRRHGNQGCHRGLEKNGARQRA